MRAQHSRCPSAFPPEFIDVLSSLCRTGDPLYCVPVRHCLTVHFVCYPVSSLHSGPVHYSVPARCPIPRRAGLPGGPALALGRSDAALLCGRPRSAAACWPPPLPLSVDWSTPPSTPPPPARWRPPLPCVFCVASRLNRVCLCVDTWLRWRAMLNPAFCCVSTVSLSSSGGGRAHLARMHGSELT